jgi:hypothetical protein
MRLWTLHPKYLDARGLVAVWREALLAQKVLRGLTIGYRSHPQLTRFRNHPDPRAFLAAYLMGIYEEAVRRGYRFDSGKIELRGAIGSMVETKGQLLYEWEHLMSKLRKRDTEQFARLAAISLPKPHPLFKIVTGGVRDWERIVAASSSKASPSRPKSKR